MAPFATCTGIHFRRVFGGFSRGWVAEERAVGENGLAIIDGFVVSMRCWGVLIRCFAAGDLHGSSALAYTRCFALWPRAPGRILA